MNWDVPDSDPFDDLIRWRDELIEHHHQGYSDDQAAQDREAWARMIVNGGRPPTELQAMPTQGKVIVASQCRWQAAIRRAAEQGLDYFINDLVPSDAIWVIDLDKVMDIDHWDMGFQKG